MNKIDNRAYSGAIYDIIKFDLKYKEKFVLPREIRPVFNYTYFAFGRAFTARGDKTPKPNHRIVSEMIDIMGQEDVYVLQANDNSRAHFGDIMSNFLSRAGVQGVVIQGWTRDALRLGSLPVWCKGVQPQDSADRWGITYIQDTIVIGNIFINPFDDYIFADTDGVLVIKEHLIKEVVDRLPEKLNYEQRVRDEINSGKTAGHIYDTIGRW